MKSANVISYPVKATRATLNPRCEAQDAVGFPVSTTIVTLADPAATTLEDGPTAYPISKTASVLGLLQDRSLGRPEFYPLRTTIETVAAGEEYFSGAPEPSMYVDVADVIALERPSAKQHKRGPRGFAAVILLIVMAPSAAALVAWKVSSLVYPDRESSPEDDRFKGEALPKRPAFVVAEPLKPSSAAGSSVTAAQETSSGESGSITSDLSVLTETKPVEVSRPAAKSELPIIALEPPPAPIRESLDVAAADAVTAISKADEVLAQPHPPDALWLLADGQRRIQAGDVPGAREQFKRAVDQGLAKAALALGSTYNPRSLADMGLRGVVPDTSVALNWYRRAHLMTAEGKNLDVFDD